MNPQLEKIADFLQLNLSHRELEELVRDLEFRAKDEYYKLHPEEAKHG